jgi:siderophore synthetase component
MTSPRPATSEVVTHTLLNCLLRELAVPEGQADVVGEHVIVRLPRVDRELRARLRRRSPTGAHRFTGPAETPDGTTWRPVGWRELTDLLCAELTLRTGQANDELVEQVASSSLAIDALLQARPATADANRTCPMQTWLASEQALVYGHRYHPSGKARSGQPQEWLAHAPEAGARFPLHLLRLTPDVSQERTTDGGPQLLQAVAGDGVLPVHPGQWARLRTDPDVQAALTDGRLTDLGPGGPAVVPTSSVRTVWHPADAFCKLSLDIRITNCVRRNAAYELDGAVALTELLAPVADDLAARHPGTVLLREPAYRTVNLGRRDLTESLGVIVREGLRGRLLPGATPLLAAAVADEHAQGPWAVRALLARQGGGADAAVAWWDAYVGCVLPPVLTAYLEHGVVLEPHLQNVVVAVAADGLPVQAVLRDLEGTKLVDTRWREQLRALPAEVATQIAYDPGRGWDRVVYCLLVNHLGEVLGAVADVHPDLEDVLWGRLRAALLRFRAEHGDTAPLRALLSGVPLPGKANLLLRWSRQADRAAGYVPVANPLGGRPHAGAW